MEEVSTFIWGLSIALNILIVLIGLPLCLLICCCCRKSSTIKKDVASIMANHNLLNDYYRLTLKNARSPVENNANRNVQLLEKFFQTYGIAITRRPSEFNWSNVSARLLVNINDYTTHETLFKEYMLGERFNEVHVMCSAVSTKYTDFLDLFNAGNLNFVYLENYAEFEKMGIYSFQNAVEKPGVRAITKRYELPYHVKRYWLRNPHHELFILTSANLTPQAWCKNGFKNVELGIIIELKKI